MGTNRIKLEGEGEEQGLGLSAALTSRRRMEQKVAQLIHPINTPAVPGGATRSKSGLAETQLP